MLSYQLILGIHDVVILERNVDNVGNDEMKLNEDDNNIISNN